MAKMYEARLGRIVVAYEVLEEMLAVPAGTKIRRVTHDSIYNRACELVVTSPELIDDEPEAVRIAVRAVLAELVRLAEGSDDAD